MYEHLALGALTAAQVTERGYAVGFNLRSDGWGALAWPVPLRRSPVRYGAMAMGLPVGDLRQRQQEIVSVAARLLQAYRTEIGVVGEERATRGSARP